MSTPQKRPPRRSTLRCPRFRGFFHRDGGRDVTHKRYLLTTRLVGHRHVNIVRYRILDLDEVHAARPQHLDRLTSRVRIFDGDEYRHLKRQWALDDGSRSHDMGPDDRAVSDLFSQPKNVFERRSHVANSCDTFG
jgi:hypothetical protein